MFLVELKRCFHSKGYRISILIGMIISILHTIQIYLASNQFEFNIYLLTERYLGADYWYVWHTVYLWICPVLASLPYSGSFYRDRENGYWNHLVTKNKNIYEVRYVVTFLSGMVAVIAPLLSNILFVAMFLPVGVPQHMDLQTSIMNTSILGELHFSNPLLYTAIFWFIIALFGGLFACIALSLSSILRNSFNLMVYPTFILIFLNLVANQEGKTEWGLFNMIDEAQLNHIKWKPIVIVLVTGYLLTYTYFCVYKKHKDVLEV